MHAAEIFSLSFGALSDRKVRTILTVLMVLVGSSLMVGLNGLSAGQTAFVEQQLNQLATNVLFVSSGQRSFNTDTSASSIILNSVSVGKIKSLSYVDDVVPEYTGSVTLNTQGSILRASVLAMDPQKLAVIVPNVQYVDGSSVKGSDSSAMLVGDSIANPPGATNTLVTIGQTVKLTYSYTDANGNPQKESRSFIVSGVLQPTGYNQVDRAIIINEATGNQILHKSGKYDVLNVAAQTSDDVDTVQQEITGLYGSTIGVTTPKAIMAIRDRFTSGNSSFILSVGLIALVVGAVGIVTTLYNSVTERIREIGTMKAIGAKGRDILALFLVEAILIGLLGASIGSLVGIGAGYALSSISIGMPGAGAGSSHVTPIFLPIDMIKVWILSVVLSIGAGILPAWKASRLSPMVALRRE
jgi:putative ABC transport system permease protein